MIISNQHLGYFSDGALTSSIDSGTPASASFLTNLWDNSKLIVASAVDAGEHWTGIDPNADYAAQEFASEQSDAGTPLTAAQMTAVDQSEANGALTQAAQQSVADVENDAKKVVAAAGLGIGVYVFAGLALVTSQFWLPAVIKLFKGK